MQVSRLTRWLGLLGVIGGSLAISTYICWAIVGPSMHSVEWIILVDLFALAFLFVQISQIGLYRYQSPHRPVIRWTGFIYFGIMAISISLRMILAVWLKASTEQYGIDPLFRDDVLLVFNGLYIVIYIGWILFGVYIAIKQIFPRWLGIMLVIGSLLRILPLNEMFAMKGIGAHIHNFDALMLLNLAYILLGWIVWRSKPPQIVEEAEQTPVEETEQIGE